MRRRSLAVLLAFSLTDACGSGSVKGGGDSGGPPRDGSAADGAARPDGTAATDGTAALDGGGPTPLSHDIGSCPVFPPYDGTPDDSYWNADVSDTTKFPTDPNSANYITYMNGGAGSTGHLHPDFGSNPAYGIPFDTVPGTQAKVPITFTYACESDPGPYPFPADAPIEVGCDHHVLVIDRDACILYEAFAASYDPSTGSWMAGSGAVFDLKAAGPLRPDGWTSADAAGLPIFPGLARYEEVSAGSIDHALRFTMAHTQNGYVHPATHYASSITDPNAPPMGLRLRLTASAYAALAPSAPPESKVILTALYHYGMILADNGSNWYISGSTDPRWNDCDLDYLKTVPGTDFEVVKLADTIHH